MAECSRHPGNVLPGCHYCRYGTEPVRFEEPGMDENSDEYSGLLYSVRLAIARGVSPAHVRQAVNLITRDYEQYGEQAATVAREDFISER